MVHQVLCSNPCVSACSALAVRQLLRPATHPLSQGPTLVREYMLQTAAGGGDQPDVCPPITVGGYTQVRAWPERRHRY